MYVQPRARQNTYREHLAGCKYRERIVKTRDHAVMQLTEVAHHLGEEVIETLHGEGQGGPDLML